jgi:hypothetical protein
MLEPGQEYRSAISVGVLDTREAMRECWVDINQLQDMGTSVAGCRLADFAR